jgi:hypothetical protein
MDAFTQIVGNERGNHGASSLDLRQAETRPMITHPLGPYGLQVESHVITNLANVNQDKANAMHNTWRVLPKMRGIISIGVSAIEYSGKIPFSDFLEPDYTSPFWRTDIDADFWRALDNGKHISTIARNIKETVAANYPTAYMRELPCYAAYAIAFAPLLTHAQQTEMLRPWAAGFDFPQGFRGRA